MEKTNKRIFQGIYSSYFAVLITCKLKNFGRNYPWEIWVKRQEKFLEAARTGRMPRDNSILDLPNIQFKKIVEFGGGIGWTYSVFRSRQNEPFEYSNFETLDTLEMLSSSNPQIDWQDAEKLSLEDLYDCDLFYTNSALQYLSPKELARIISILRGSNVEYLLFDDFQLTNRKSFWSVQKFYKYNLIIHFMNLRETIFMFEKIGYKLIDQKSCKNIFADGWLYEVKSRSNADNLLMPMNLLFKKVRD